MYKKLTTLKTSALMFDSDHVNNTMIRSRQKASFCVALALLFMNKKQSFRFSDQPFVYRIELGCSVFSLVSKSKPD